MGRWAVRVFGQLNDEARTALRDAGIEAADPQAGEEGFTALLDADDSTDARSRVEETLQAAGGYSAGAATSAD